MRPKGKMYIPGYDRSWALVYAELANDARAPPGSFAYRHRARGKERPYHELLDSEFNGFFETVVAFQSNF